jgi:hypothetical protein
MCTYMYSTRPSIIVPLAGLRPRLGAWRSWQPRRPTLQLNPSVRGVASTHHLANRDQVLWILQYAQAIQQLARKRHQIENIYQLIRIVSSHHDLQFAGGEITTVNKGKTVALLVRWSWNLKTLC